MPIVIPLYDAIFEYRNSIENALAIFQKRKVAPNAFYDIKLYLLRTYFLSTLVRNQRKVD